MAAEVLGLVSDYFLSRQKSVSNVRAHMVFLLGMMHSPGFEGNLNFSFQTLMNADSLYMVSHYTLLLNLKLVNSDYYRKKPAQAPVSLVSWGIWGTC